MQNNELEHVAESFVEHLKEEVVRQANVINHRAEDDGDGYSTKDIDDGWVTLKGMAWGFAIEHNPLRLVMTTGPDRPFVGCRHVLEPRESANGEILWSNPQEALLFSNPCELASFGLSWLSKLLHEPFHPVNYHYSQ